MFVGEKPKASHCEKYNIGDKLEFIAVRKTIGAQITLAMTFIFEI